MRADLSSFLLPLSGARSGRRNFRVETTLGPPLHCDEPVKRVTGPGEQSFEIFCQELIELYNGLYLQSFDISFTIMLMKVSLLNDISR